MFLGGVVLSPVDAAAAPQHPPAKARPHKASATLAAKKPRAAKPPKRSPAVRARLPGAEVGLADVLDHGGPGLHGLASFYGHGFQGRRTSTGERFDVREFTGASNHFPLGSRVAVRRLDDARCAIVRINDRMHGLHRRRVVDVSRSAAEYLGMIRAGVVLVRVAAVVGEGRDDAACLSAFAAEACGDGLACGQPPHWPDFPAPVEATDEIEP